MYIKIHAHAGAKSELWIEKDAMTFLVSVKEKPEQNQANTKIRTLVALHFKVLPSQVRIVSGHHHPHKILAIEDRFITK